SAMPRAKPEKFDRRRVKDNHKASKDRAYKHGLWVPKGMNDIWLMTEGWEQYYKRRCEAVPPQKDEDLRLIALARAEGVKMIPRTSQLTDEWRCYLIDELRVARTNAALRKLHDEIFSAPPQPKRKGKPKGAWNKKPEQWPEGSEQLKRR